MQGEANLKKKAEMKTKGKTGSKDKNGYGIPDHEIEALARCFLPAIREYYETDEGKKAFAKWECERGDCGKPQSPSQSPSHKSRKESA
jgi:hypothetical protein